MRRRVLASEALERELKAPRIVGESPKRVKLPLIRSKRPGSLKLTNAQLEEILSTAPQK